MTSKSLGYIQEIEDDDSKLDCSSKCKKLGNCIMKNKIIGELDSFSMDVKFSI